MDKTYILLSVMTALYGAYIAVALLRARPRRFTCGTRLQRWCRRVRGAVLRISAAAHHGADRDAAAWERRPRR